MILQKNYIIRSGYLTSIADTANFNDIMLTQGQCISIDNIFTADFMLVTLFSNPPYPDKNGAG